MEKVSVDDLDPEGSGRSVDHRGLTEPLGTTDVAINRYRLEPGERTAGLHAHVDQEEVFVVVDGELAFETLDGEVSVEAGEAVRFAPGEFQSGKNDSDAAAVVYALGAPRDTEDFRVPVPCPDCGRGDTRPSIASDEQVLACPDCGAESAVECAECGGSDKRVEVADDGVTPVDVCLDCGAESVL